jgi:hypothetical protein
MALINRKIAKQVETVFPMPSEEYSYLSSTIIKDVATHGGALTEFLHPEVAPTAGTDQEFEIMKLAARAGRIAPSPTLAIAATAKAMAGRGIDVVDFSSENRTSIHRNRSRPPQKPQFVQGLQNTRPHPASMNCDKRLSTSCKWSKGSGTRNFRY